MSKMRLRTKVLIGWLGLELAALPFAIPAFAAFKDRISFSVPQKAISVPLPSVPGELRYLVASNAPFAIVSTGLIGEIDVEIIQSGNASGIDFGSKAQMPGTPGGCSFVTAAAPTRIYTANDKTAAKRGDITDQAVLVTVRFDPELSPRLSVESMDAAMTRLLALPCDPKAS